MKGAAAKRLAARRRRAQRRDLVHAAGCTHDLCAVRRAAFADYEIVNEALANGIRVPRSVMRVHEARYGSEEGSNV